mgnify:CR=1 FL=1
MSGITSLFQYDFMRNAFLAVLIITPLFGILGTMIVNNKMAFFSDALGHSALTGIAVGRGMRNSGYKSVHGDLWNCFCIVTKLDQK